MERLADNKMVGRVGIVRLETPTYNRGDIVYCELNGKGSVQAGLRPCIIVSNNVGNKYSPLLSVVPLTTKMTKRPLPTHVTLEKANGLTATSVALCEQILTVDKSQVVKVISKLGSDVMSKINNAVMIQLGLN